MFLSTKKVGEKCPFFIPSSFSPPPFLFFTLFFLFLSFSLRLLSSYIFTPASLFLYTSEFAYIHSKYYFCIINVSSFAFLHIYIHEIHDFFTYCLLLFSQNVYLHFFMFTYFLPIY